MTLPNFYDNAPMALLTAIVLIALTAFLGLAGYKTFLEAGEVGSPEPQEHTITVEGQSRVQLVPDIATVNIGVETVADTTEEAQAQNTETMDAIMERLREAGIPEKDLQTTGYNVYEKKEYDREEGRSITVGWAVNQHVEVTARDIELVPDVLRIAGQNGATNVNGPNFRIDDPFAQREAAREDAIANARMAANDLAQKLGVDLDDVVGYDERVGGSQPAPSADMMRFGLGGAEELAPDVAPGEEELTLNVSLTFRIE